MKKQLIMAAIDTVRARGYRITDGIWFGVDNATCCPLGACLLVDGYGWEDLDYEKPAAELLGATLAEVRAFIEGFDGIPVLRSNNSDAYNLDAYNLGVEMRKYAGLPDAK